MSPKFTDLSSSDALIHSALLQEGLACQHLFGLGEDPFHARGQLGSPLWKSSFRDVLLVSVHIISQTSREDGDYKPILVGISTLDLRDLQSYVDSVEQELPDIIKSHQLEVGNQTKIKTETGRFLFGDPQLVEEARLGSQLRELVGNRQIVLVTYGGKPECKYVEQIGVHPLYHLDVLKLVQFPLRIASEWSLSRVLDTLKLPWQDMDAPGNYARFTLHALLMMVVKDWGHRSTARPSLPIQTILWSLRTIAKAWPAPKQEQTALAYFFGDYPKIKNFPEPLAPTKVIKPRPEKAPKEKAQHGERNPVTEGESGDHRMIVDLSPSGFLTW